MYSTFLKFLFTFIFSFYIIHKMLKKPIDNSTTKYVLLFSVFLASIGHLLNTYIYEFKYLIPLLLFWIYISICYISPQIAFVSSIFSFCISYSMYAISSFIVSFIIFVSCGISSKFPHEVLALFSAVLQYILVYLLFKSKRLSNGIHLLMSASYINWATVLCLTFISLTTYFRRHHVVALLSVFFTLAFLIYWWQAQITKAYRRKLELRELESLRTEVAELNLVVARLKEENDKLAHITHRDNTLIASLKNSTISYLSTDFKNPDEAFATREKLVANINSLSTERATLFPESYDRKVRSFDTGLPLLDELLCHMNEEAHKSNITFSVHLATVLTDFVPKDISENDLTHIVDDLLKNAFKSTTTCEKRSVQLQFYKLGKHFVVEVADNGIPFEIKSLVNMGLEKITTYADGSGIGLVDIWNTKEKYGATYHLDEYMNQTAFTKKISLTFDKKNLYSIRTWRKEEILQLCKRTDLQVYNYSE